MRFPSKLLFLAALITLLPAVPNAQPQPAPPQSRQQTEQKENVGSITVVLVTGEVYVFTSGETYRIALRAGSLVTGGQMIATGPKASVMLAFSNGTTVTIGEKSLVALDEFTQQPFGEMFKMSEATSEPSSSQTRLDMVRGEILANVKKLNKEEGSTFEVKTPLGVAGIRGTTFQISYIPDAPADTSGAKRPVATADFAIVMLEGAIEMSVPNKQRPISVTQGKQLVLEDVDIAAADGGTLNLDESDMAPQAVPAAAQALLLQRAQTMLAAAADISIPASHPGLPPPPSRGPVEQAQEKAGQKQDSAPKDDTSSDENVSPSPAPQNPAPRLSPTDGTGKD